MIATLRYFFMVVDLIDHFQSKGLLIYQVMTKVKIVVAKGKLLLARFMKQAVCFAEEMLLYVNCALVPNVRRFIHG